MFISQTRLPHLLSPSDYHSEQQYQRERENVLMPAWHVVSTTSELKNDGDFVTRELFGFPIQIRNFAGELRVLSNICAHRHCLISSKSKGNSPRMTCQYHGWEYGSDGRTRKIPEPKNFAPFSDKGECVPVYRTETCGQLVFVSLVQTGISLPDFLGDYHEVIQDRFGENSKEFLRFDTRYAANWKVPIENSLEAYHIPSVHPKTFREDPGDDRSTHLIKDTSTAFGTALPFSPHSVMEGFIQRNERRVMRLLGQPVADEYWQHHLYPTLMMSFTDANSLIHCVIPTGPTTSIAIVRQFSMMGKSRRGPRRWFGNLWGSLKGRVTKVIMKEDLELIPEIQKGLQNSTEDGVLGRCEERIHAFQEFIVSRTKAVDSKDVDAKDVASKNENEKINASTAADQACHDGHDCTTIHEPLRQSVPQPQTEPTSRIDE